MRRETITERLTYLRANYRALAQIEGLLTRDERAEKEQLSREIERLERKI